MKTWKLNLELTSEYYERLFNANAKKFIECSEEEVNAVNDAMLSCLDPKQQDFSSYTLLRKENYREFCNLAKDEIQKNPLGTFAVYTETEEMEYANPGVLKYLYATITERESLGI